MKLPFDIQPVEEPFGDRFWPLDRHQVTEVEARIGWTLPGDYVEFVTEYGICEPTNRQLVPVTPDGGETEYISFAFFFGANDDPTASILSDFLDHEEPTLLAIAESASGYFYLHHDGWVSFEPNHLPERFPIDSSFTGFLNRFRPAEDDGDGHRRGVEPDADG